ncbi:MAG: MFS transporter [Sedimentisphaerales bacterium]|nr:MFS transporter [Sedimentisphaerales bacterium]
MSSNGPGINSMKPRFNMGFIWRISLVAAMGGLLFGYDWVVIGGAKPFYEPFFHISGATLFLRGWVMSSALVGCLAGAVVSGMLTDRFGRKRLLVCSGFLFTISAIGTGLADNLTIFNIYRIIGGIGIGLASNLSPMYIAEISPAAVRGKFVSINQLTVVIGILAAQLVNFQIAERFPSVDQIRLLCMPETQVQVIKNSTDFNPVEQRAQAQHVVDETALAKVIQEFPEISWYRPTNEEQKKLKEIEDTKIMDAYLSNTWTGKQGWRWMFWAETVLALSFFVLMFFVPESPRWLVKMGRNTQAQTILARVGGADYAGAEVTDIKTTLAKEEIAQVHYSDLLQPRLLKIVGIGVFLAVFQQWCGINVIFNYAQEVFSAAGYGVNNILTCILTTGVVNLLFTFVAIYTVDHFGRRALMLIGAGGLTLIYAVLGTGYFYKSTGIHMLILVLLAIACYAMSLAPVVWVVISEIFPNRIRGAAVSVAVFSLWVGCTFLTLTFPKLNEVLKPYGTFWLYGGVCVIGYLFILKYLPETKGKSLENIERELVD